MSSPITESRWAITPDSRAGLIIIVTAISLIWTLSVLIIRLASKLQVKNRLGLEEVLVVLATIFAVISSALVLSGVTHGLGEVSSNLSGSDIRKALEYTYLADIFYVLGIAASKGGGLPLITGLTPVRAHILACYILGGFIGCWALASFFLVVLRCHPSVPYLDAGITQCPNLFARWVAIESISIFIEIAIFAISVSVVWLVKLKWHAKIKVLFAFSTRLPVIIPIAYRLKFLGEDLYAPDQTFGLVNSTIATQVVLHYTVMAASFAYLKPFLAVFDSNLCATVKFDQSRSYNSSSQSRGGSVSAGRLKSEVGANTYQMSNLEQRRNSTMSSRNSRRVSQTYTPRKASVRSPHTVLFEDQIEADDQRMSRTHPTYTTAGTSYPTSPSAGAAPQERVASARESLTGSEDPIITKTQEWDVRSETGHGDTHAM